MAPKTAASSSWAEHHVNFTMALAWLAVTTAGFILLFVTQNESGESLLSIFGSLAFLGLLVGVWGLQAKKRSLSWMFFFFIPLGFLVIFILANKRTAEAFPPRKEGVV